MGLFQRQPINNSQPLYVVGEQKTLLIVGLGNIGKEYDGTRHNIGFAVLDHFADKQRFDGWVAKKQLHCQQVAHILGNTRVILCKPTTFMNDSGRAVQTLQRFYKVNNSSTLVVYDELDIGFGQIRTRIGGGSAGHNGIKSLITHLGEDFGRVRIGIGPKKPEQTDSADFVLSKFDKPQEKQLPLLLQETSAILSEYSHSSGQLIDETRSFII
jgi:PTH1 family peptidyl-tRNA hydrolase